MAPKAHQCQIVRQKHGEWDGKWRAADGFDLLGYYDSKDEAMHHVLLHIAVEYEQTVIPPAPPNAART